MTLEEFRNKYIGKKVDFDGYYGGQCVDLYRQYVQDVLGFPQSPGVGGAAEIWDSASPEYYDFIPNTPTGVPNPGDIVIWNRRVGNGFGHVAVFLRGDVNSFVSLDQNWPTLDKVTETQHTYSNVIGWLHPKETMANELEACMADRLKFWQERDAARAEVEALNTQIAGYKSRITDLSNQLGAAKAEASNQKEKASRLEVQLLDAQGTIEMIDTRLNEKQAELEQFAKEKGLLAIENAQLKEQIETLKQQQAQGEITLTFKELLHLIWNQKITIKK